VLFFVFFEVTDELRQRAKQVCYGMIYGIGKHALAEQLGVEDDDAETFMISFKSAYPGKSRQDCCIRRRSSHPCE